MPAHGQASSELARRLCFGRHQADTCAPLFRRQQHDLKRKAHQTEDRPLDRTRPGAGPIGIAPETPLADPTAHLQKDQDSDEESEGEQRSDRNFTYDDFQA